MDKDSQIVEVKRQRTIDYHYGNVSAVMASIESKHGSLHTLSPNRCIYRVPENLRKVNQAAYRPALVSIGPFHYDEPQLQSMQGQKLKYLYSLLNRTKNSLQYYINVIGEQEKAIRECYAEEIKLSSEEFVEMVLLDAAFIIELFCRIYLPRFRNEDCALFFGPSMFDVVIQDLLVEENQLPFFILNILYDLDSMSSFTDFFSSFPRISCLFISEITQQKLSLGEIWSIVSRVDGKTEIKHLVDLCRLCFLPSRFVRQEKHDNINGDTSVVKSAKELRAAGITFVPSESGQLLDIQFSKGVLEIPKLRITDRTESVFRNMVAFEQCHHPIKNSCVVDYMCFMDNLIDTPMDVDILVRSGIIENFLGNSEEVARLFNNITNQTTLNLNESKSYCYLDVCTNLNAHAGISWNRWKATLKSDYFNHPWAVISVIYALLLFVLTFIQTINSFSSDKTK